MDDNKEKQEVYPVGLTAKNIADWKTKHGVIFELNSGDLKAYIRKPTRDEMREFTAKSASCDPVTYTEIVLDALWLGGDEAIKTDDEAFYGVMPVVQGVLDIKIGELKKL